MTWKISDYTTPGSTENENKPGGSDGCGPGVNEISHPQGFFINDRYGRQNIIDAADHRAVSGGSY